MQKILGNIGAENIGNNNGNRSRGSYNVRIFGIKYGHGRGKSCRAC
jgi:hypothetical protein